MVSLSSILPPIQTVGVVILCPRCTDGFLNSATVVNLCVCVCVRACVCVCVCVSLSRVYSLQTPGSSLHEILQARILDGLPFLFPGDLPDPGIEPGSPALQADSLLSEPPGKPLGIDNLGPDDSLLWGESCAS